MLRKKNTILSTINNHMDWYLKQIESFSEARQYAEDRNALEDYNKLDRQVLMYQARYDALKILKNEIAY